MKVKLLMVISILSMLLCACSIEGNEQTNYDVNGISAEPEAQEPEEQDPEAQEKFDIQTILDAAETQAADLETKLYEDGTLTQADMNVISYEIYMVWDDTLNNIWQLLKDSLDEEIMTELLEEQRAWITKKEAEVKLAGEEVAGGSIAGLVCNQRAAKLTRIRVYELASYLGYDGAVPQNESSVEETEEVLCQEEKTTITFIVEGLEEEVPAILYIRENYSISIPEEDWEMVTEGTWRSVVNRDAQISIVDYEEDLDSVRKNLSDSGYEVSEYNPYFMSVEDRNGLVWSVKLFKKDEKVIGIFYNYPIEAAEGFGARLSAIVNTFEWK